MHDPTGKKKRTIRKLENLFFKYQVISTMIPSDKDITYHDACNLSHNVWSNPWNPAVERSESIYDLINHTMPIYLERINLYMTSCGYIDFMEFDQDSISETNYYLHYRNLLLSHLSDLSYLTGLPLD